MKSTKTRAGMTVGSLEDMEDMYRLPGGYVQAPWRLWRIWSSTRQGRAMEGVQAKDSMSRMG